MNPELRNWYHVVLNTFHPDFAQPYDLWAYCANNGDYCRP